MTADDIGKSFVNEFVLGFGFLSGWFACGFFCAYWKNIYQFNFWRSLSNHRNAFRIYCASNNTIKKKM